VVPLLPSEPFEQSPLVFFVHVLTSFRDRPAADGSRAPIEPRDRSWIRSLSASGRRQQRSSTQASGPLDGGRQGQGGTV